MLLNFGSQLCKEMVAMANKVADEGKGTSESRREFVKKAAYVVPAVVTVTVSPDFVKVGSGKIPPPVPTSSTQT